MAGVGVGPPSAPVGPPVGPAVGPSRFATIGVPVPFSERRLGDGRDRMRNRPILRSMTVVVAAVALSACAADWPQWGNGPARTSDQAAETTISASNVRTLHGEWGNGGGNLEESVTTPAVVAGGLAQADGQRTDVV